MTDEVDARVTTTSGHVQWSNDKPQLTVIGKNDECYNMEHARRGKAIIFNQITFESGLPERTKSTKDAEDLNAVLEMLSFDVSIYEDLKFGAISNVLQQLSEWDHSAYDCLLIVVMSHGERNKLHARDHHYPTDYLWKPFAGNKCPTLAGKPKLFFVQVLWHLFVSDLIYLITFSVPKAGRGDKIDDGATIRARSRIETDGSQCSTYKIPTMADFLIMYSSFEGYSCMTDNNGSWFIQSLCKSLKEYAESEHILRILTFANRIVALDKQSNVPGNYKLHEKKQVGTIVSSLTRLLYFTKKN